MDEKKAIERALELSGGHFQLFQLLLKNKLQQNLLDDDFIKLCLKNIYVHLNYYQKNQVLKVALGKDVDIADEYLFKTGMVKKLDTKFKLFSPLFEEYVKTQGRLKLPVKENRLFKLLKNNLGEVVPRDEIFRVVWEDNLDNATDWALDALSYRLRKNPYLLNSGYVLENHKKIGYSLVKK